VFPIQISDADILDVDEDGKSLLRLGIPVRRRGQLAEGQERVVTVAFGFPTMGQWQAYLEACATLFSAMARTVPDMFLPEDMLTLSQSVEGYRVWATACSAVCHRPMMARMLLSIVVTYLDPGVVDADGNRTREDGVKVVMDNVGIDEAVILLALILCTDQMYQKKTRSGLMMMFPQVTLSRSSAPSAKPPEPPSPTSFVGPTLTRLSYSDG
jgi:hypothetical protein